MSIEKIVERHAVNLKLEVGAALNLDECFDLINDAVKEATELKYDLLHSVSNSLPDHVVKFRLEELEIKYDYLMEQFNKKNDC